MSRLFPILLASIVPTCIFVAMRASAADAPPASAPITPSAEQILHRLNRAHPRLLIDAAGFENLKSRLASDPALKSWDASLRRDAEKILESPQPRHVLPDGLRLLDTSRRMVHDCYTLAMMARLHGDRRYVDGLWRELETVAAFPDFNPKHFLDTAEMTNAFAIAYDWLYDTWTESQRATIRRAIVEMGLKPGLDVYRKGNWWAAASHNWNQVCNGGLTMGALAVADAEPEICGEVLHDAVKSVPLAMKSYAPDGAWGEGPGYWSYATTYNVTMIAGLQSALGTDFGLSNSQGFSETGLFPLYMTGPTGRWFNFCDSGDKASGSDCLYWLADRFDQPVDAWYNASRSKPSALGAIWNRHPGKNPAEAKLPLDKYWRHVDVVTMRSAWDDPKAIFVGFLAGSNQVNHNHLDQGSFVLDGLGQRWASDLGSDNYNLPGYFGGKRYDYYRLRAEGHNTLVIDPDDKPDQTVKGIAKITRFESTPKKAFSIADLTPVYVGHAKKVERGIALLDRDALLVQDEITATKANVWWFMHTTADVKVSDDGRTATLSQAGAKFVGRILAPAAARFEVKPAEPLSTSPNPSGQRSNSGFRKLAIHLPSVGAVRLAVLFAPDNDIKERATGTTIKPLADW